MSKIVVVPNSTLLNQAKTKWVVCSILEASGPGDAFLATRFTELDPDFVVDLNEEDLLSDVGNNRYSDLLRDWNNFKEKHTSKLISAEQYNKLIIGMDINEEKVEDTLTENEISTTAD